jgi:hypothetical protein
MCTVIYGEEGLRTFVIGAAIIVTVSCAAAAAAAAVGGRARTRSLSDRVRLHPVNWFGCRCPGLSRSASVVQPSLSGLVWSGLVWSTAAGVGADSPIFPFPHQDYTESIRLICM